MDMNKTFYFVYLQFFSSCFWFGRLCDTVFPFWVFYSRAFASIRG